MKKLLSLISMFLFVSICLAQQGIASYNAVNDSAQYRVEFVYTYLLGQKKKEMTLEEISFYKDTLLLKQFTCKYVMYRIEEFKYNLEGKLIRKTSYHKPSIGDRRITTYERDSAGRLSRESTRFGTGRIANVVYEYDENNKNIRTTIQDADGVYLISESSFTKKQNCEEELSRSYNPKKGKEKGSTRYMLRCYNDQNQLAYFKTYTTQEDSTVRVFRYDNQKRIDSTAYCRGKGMKWKNSVRLYFNSVEGFTNWYENAEKKAKMNQRATLTLSWEQAKQSNFFILGKEALHERFPTLLEDIEKLFHDEVQDQ